MKTKISLIIIGVTLMVLISGCVQQATRVKIAVSPEQPMLNIYGKLIDYSQTDELIVFKIQTEFVNYELNNTYLEINGDISTTPDLTKTFTINRIEDLEIDKVYTVNDVSPNHVYKGMTNDSMGEDILVFGQSSIAINDFRKATYIVHTPVSELNKGKNYIFYFRKKDEETMWNLVKVSENIMEYKQDGIYYHKDDLTRDQMTIVGEGVNSTLITPTEIIPGESTELKIILINKQDNDIKYKITNVNIVDELIYFPFTSRVEEKYMDLPSIDIRLNNAVVKNCKVKYEAGEKIIQANSNKILSFSTICNEPIIRERTYKSCDIRGEKCKDITTETMFLLWGEIEFTDELGNKHIFPERGILKQELKIK